MQACRHADCECLTLCLRSHCPVEHVEQYDRLMDRQREQPAVVAQLAVLYETGPVDCDGSYACACETCVGERVALVDNVTRIQQPWEARPARSRAA